MTTTTTDPVRLTITVACDLQTAFDTFTQRMGEWWPLRTHSIAEADAVGVDFEGRAGGAVWELTRDGQRHKWADIVAWDPPRRIVMAWKPNLRPVEPTEVELRFEATEAGTKVDLEHRAWERLGAEAGELREGYVVGWPRCLQLFAGAVGAA